MNRMGFELYINGKKYLVKCDTSIITNTSERDTSNKVNLRIRVFEDGEFIKLDKDGYVAEKITDFIRNCINGQDNVYWDWDEPNRHLENTKHYLKWEDLEFGKTTHKLKAKMNDSLYRIEWYVDGMGSKVVFLYKYITNDYLIHSACIKEYNQQFFNDLRLERVEE